MPNLSDPLTLPCGAVLPNRLCKAAMTEGLADPMNRAHQRHATLYGTWSDGGAGLLLTGNVQVDRTCLEGPGNVAIDNNGGESELEAWAKAAKRGGNAVWMQISHGGRQTPKLVNPEPLAPSAVPLNLPGGQFGQPRAMTAAEIRDVIARFVHTAAVAKATGFDGVQIHGAHGYLISQFLSPLANRRTDEWGGSLENRARLLLEIVKSVRAEVGPDFPVSVKLNSADFQKGGFGFDDCLQVVEWLNAANIDLLEISGGSYEQPQMMGLEGDAQSADPRSESTKVREAFFLDYAEKIRGVAKMPLMVTGGFRTRAGMQGALDTGDADVIGLGRPLCVEPDLPKRILSGEAEAGPAVETELRLGPGFFSPHSKSQIIKGINVWGIQNWFYMQIWRMSQGEAPDRKLGLVKALVKYTGLMNKTAKAYAKTLKTAA